MPKLCLKQRAQLNTHTHTHKSSANNRLNGAHKSVWMSRINRHLQLFPSLFVWLFFPLFFSIEHTNTNTKYYRQYKIGMREERAVNGSALKRQLSVSLGFSLGFYDVDSLVVAIFYPAQLCLSNCFVVCVRACCVVCAIPFPFSPPLFLFCCFLLLLPPLIFMHT